MLSRIQPEDVAVLSVRGNGEVPLTGERCDGLTIRRGRVYSSGIVGVSIQEPARTLVERVYVMPRPGTDRLLSTAADGQTLALPVQTISADVLAADVPAATSLGGAVIAVGAARGTLFIDSEDPLLLSN